MTAQIRFKPHLKAHKISAGEVVLLGESEQYVLRGAVYGALTPLLDGGHDADALASQLAGQFRPELVHYALMQLEAKGYAESGAGSGGGADLAWWSAKGIQPGEADRTLMRREVALLNAGAPEAAYAPLLAALGERFRIAETAGPDGFAVIACSDYLDPRLAAAVSAAMNTGCPALPVRIGGGQIWLGPLLDGGARDFELLQRRMTNIRSPERSILACGGAFPLLPEQGIAESHKFAASAIASAVLATLLGQPPKGIRRGVITLDPWTLESKTHVLAGGGPAETMAVPEIGEEREPVRLEARPRRFSSDGGVRSATPEETLERLEPLVSEITGIIPELHKFPAPEGMHVFGASQLFASRGADHRQNRVLGRSSSAAGKGQTAIQAKVSCLGEAVERYSCSFFGDEPVRRARISGFGGQAIGPAELLLFSERQYALRDVNNPVRGAFNWTPMPFDPERETGWTPAWSLTHERTVWLPVARRSIRITISAAPIPMAARPAIPARKRSFRGFWNLWSATLAPCGGTTGCAGRESIWAASVRPISTGCRSFTTGMDVR
jgi:ribosomal protein S12 methylthiotransferase accessory factor